MDQPDQLKPKRAGAAFIAALIAEIAESLPDLEELSPEAATHIMRLAVVDELKDQVRRRVASERFDWKAERATPPWQPLLFYHNLPRLPKVPPAILE